MKRKKPIQFRGTATARRFAPKVVRTSKEIEFFSADAVSFTPGFSQVNSSQTKIPLTLKITRLKESVGKIESLRVNSVISVSLC